MIMLDKIKNIVMVVGVIAFAALVVMTCVWLIYAAINTGDIHFVVFTACASVALVCIITYALIVIFTD